MCALCTGAGSFVCMAAGRLEWWTCPACGGAGVRVLHGPPTIRTHARPQAGQATASKVRT